MRATDGTGARQRRRFLAIGLAYGNWPNVESDSNTADGIDENHSPQHPTDAETLSFAGVHFRVAFGVG
jgi:hypothetical protein